MFGRSAKFFISLYEYLVFVGETIYGLFRGPFYGLEVLYQMKEMGVSSLPIVVLTSLTTGMVFALQTGHALSYFGAKMYVGTLVGLSMLMELGPVLTALVLAGRVGSGIAAEVASMRVTEQIDAMRAMATNPIKKLSSTRFLAGMIIVPLLTYISILSGILGGMIVAVLNLGISLPFYKQSVFRMMMMRDVFVGFVKPFFFGFIIITVGAFVGFTSEGGTEGVGKSTTKSVVISSILVLVGDYFLTKVLLMILY